MLTLKLNKISSEPEFAQVATLLLDRSALIYTVHVVTVSVIEGCNEKS